jgi:hypothetical protein
MACRPLGGHQPMPGENDRVTDPNWDSGKMERSINPYPTEGSMEPPPSIGHRSGRDQPGCQFAKGYPSWEVFLVLPIFQNLAVLSSIPLRKTGLAIRPGLESCFRTFPATTREPVRISGGACRVHWVRPEMVVAASHLERTPGGRLRHVVYRGEREDQSTVRMRRNSPCGDRK